MSDALRRREAPDGTEIVSLPSESQHNTFHLLCPEVTDAAQLLQMQAVDIWIKGLSARRKVENARLIAMEKLWAQRKEELAPQVMRVLAQARGKVATLLATTYETPHESSVTWPKEHDTELMDWINQETTPGLWATDYKVETRNVLTPEGRERFKQVLLETAMAGNAIPDFVEIRPAGKSFATRPKASPALDAQTILAQHQVGLDRLIDPNDDQEPQDDQENP